MIRHSVNHNHRFIEITPHSSGAALIVTNYIVIVLIWTKGVVELAHFVCVWDDVLKGCGQLVREFRRVYVITVADI